MPNVVKIAIEAKDNATRVFDNIKKDAPTGFGLGVGAAVGAKAMGLLDRAAAGAIDTVTGFINSASDLNETVSKAGVIFGKNADEVNQWAGTMATAAGVSKKAALDAASGFAGLFKTVGLGIDDATSMSEKLTQMGSDLASFFNTDVDTALNALKSGLNGEAEPLRQFNIFLSDTAVAGELAKQGIKKVGGQFTEAQKATARYALIMEQTKDAQGDFARTSDGLANTQRQLNAEMENVSAEIGQDLLPLVLDLAHGMRDVAIPAVIGFMDVIGEAGKGLSFWGDNIGDFVNRLNNLDNVSHYADVGQRKLSHSQMLAAAAAGEAADATKVLGGAAKTAAGQAGTLASKTDTAAQRAQDLADAAKDAKQRLDDMRGAIRSAADALNTQKRGHEETNLKIKDASLDIKDARDELRKLEAIKDPTRDQRQSMIQLKLRILEDQDEIQTLKADLAASGKVSMSVTDKWLQKVRDDGSEAGDSIAYLADQLHRVGAPVGGSGGGSRPSHPVSDPNSPGHGAASGGYRPAGWTGMVGEEGDERLTALPGGGIMVTPHQGGGGSGSGGHTFNITMQGIGSDVSAGAAHAYALAVADTITQQLKLQSRRQF